MSRLRVLFSAVFFTSIFLCVTEPAQAQIAKGDNIYAGVIGSADYAIAPNEAHEHQFSLNKDEGLVASLVTNSGLPTKCYDDIELKVVDSLGRKQGDDTAYDIPPQSESVRIGGGMKAPTAGLHKVLVYRDSSVSNDACSSVNFSYTLTTTHHTGHVVPTKRVQASTAIYSDHLTFVDAHEYLFSIGKNKTF